MDLHEIFSWFLRGFSTKVAYSCGQFRTEYATVCGWVRNCPQLYADFLQTVRERVRRKLNQFNIFCVLYPKPQNRKSTRASTQLNVTVRRLLFFIIFANRILLTFNLLIHSELTLK